MIAIIKNIRTYPREVQFYGRNQYIVLEAYCCFKVNHVYSPSEISYYESLIPQGFKVCFRSESGDTCLCNEVIKYVILKNERDY